MLYACPECGNPVAPLAMACPYCGAPLQPPPGAPGNNDVLKGIFAASGVKIAIYCFLMFVVFSIIVIFSGRLLAGAELRGTMQKERDAIAHCDRVKARDATDPKARLPVEDTCDRMREEFKEHYGTAP